MQAAIRMLPSHNDNRYYRDHHRNWKVYASSNPDPTFPIISHQAAHATHAEAAPAPLQRHNNNRHHHIDGVKNFLYMRQ